MLEKRAEKIAKDSTLKAQWECRRSHSSDFRSTRQKRTSSEGSWFLKSESEAEVENYPIKPLDKMVTDQLVEEVKMKQPFNGIIFHKEEGYEYDHQDENYVNGDSANTNENYNSAHTNENQEHDLLIRDIESFVVMKEADGKEFNRDTAKESPPAKVRLASLFRVKTENRKRNGKKVYNDNRNSIGERISIFSRHSSMV